MQRTSESLSLAERAVGAAAAWWEPLSARLESSDELLAAVSPHPEGQASFLDACRTMTFFVVTRALPDLIDPPLAASEKRRQARALRAGMGRKLGRLYPDENATRALMGTISDEAEYAARWRPA